MIGMKVREGDVRNATPIHAEVGKAVHGATATIEEQPHCVALDEMGGRHSIGVRGGRASTDGV
jgi:hypothetical protein